MYFYALNITDGSMIWKFNTNGEIESHAAYEGGVVYVTAEESMTIFALNATTGMLG